MTLFEPNPANPSDIQEAGRLARIALGIWFGGWVAAFLSGSLLMSGGSGDVAMLGGFVAQIMVLVIGGAATAISLRLTWRALRLDPSSLLPKITIGMNGLSLAYVVVVGGLLLSDVFR